MKAPAIVCAGRVTAPALFVVDHPNCLRGISPLMMQLSSSKYLHDDGQSVTAGR